MQLHINKGKVQFLDLGGKVNLGGQLHFWEKNDLFPKGIQRCFWITAVPENESRGNHAHWKESQVLVAMHGVIQVEVHQPGQQAQSFTLDQPGKGLFVPPMHWVKTSFSTDAVLLGMSDREFSESDYIRDLAYFESLGSG